MSEQSTQIVKNFLGDSGKAKYDREALGWVAEDDKQVFTSEQIDTFFAQPGVTLKKLVPFIFVVIDPCVGSLRKEKRLSDFCIVSMVTPNTIVGVDAFDATVPEHYQDRLIKHIERLKKNPMMVNAPIVLDVESGTGMEVSHITAWVKNHFPDVISMNDDLTKRKPGTRTGEDTKQDMVTLTQCLLDMDAFMFWKDLKREIAPELLAKMKSQFKGFERIVKPGKTLGSATHVIFTGKSKGLPDDMCMTAMRAVLAVTKFYSENQYKKHY